MSEKLKLFELDIDIQALTENTAKALREVNNLDDGQKALKKSTQDLRKEIDGYQKALKNPELKKNSKESAELNAKLKDAKQRYDENTIAQVKNQTSLKSSRKEYQLGLKMVDAYTEKQRKNIVIISQTDGSIDQLSAALSKNKAAYKSLSKEERENSEIAVKLKKLLDEQNKEYKKLHVEMGNTGVMVGTYKDQIKEAAMEMGYFGQAKAQFMGTMAPFIPLLKSYSNQWKGIIGDYKNAAAGTKGYTAAQKAATIAQNLSAASLKLLKIALVSTGIGAFVILIGALIAYFSKSQKGIDKWNQVLAGAKAIVSVFTDRLIKLGGALIKLAKFDFKGFKDDAVSAFTGIGTEIANETVLAIQLEKKLQDISKATVLLDIQRAASKRTIKDLNKIGEDTSKGLDERIEALQKAYDIEESLAKKQLKLSEDRLANAIGEVELTEEGAAKLEKFRQGAISADEAIASLGISESNLADLEEFRDLFVDVENKQSEMAEIGTTVQNKINTLIREEKRLRETAAKEALDQLKKQTDAALSESKTQLDIYIAENENKHKTLKESLAFEQTIHDKLLDQYKAELDAKKLTKSEYDLLVIQAQQDLLHRQSELTVENAAKELDLYIANNQSKLDADKDLTAESVRQEEERLYTLYEKQLEFFQLQKEQGLLNESDFNLQKLQLQEDYLEQQKAIDTEFDTQKREQDQIDWEGKLELRRLQGDSEYQLQLEQLEREHKAIVEAAKKNGTYTLLIEQTYAAKRQKIIDLENDGKTQAYADTAGNLAVILGKETAAGKAAAVAQTTINTYKAATAAYSAMAEIPVVGPALGAIAAAAAVVSGVKSIQKIVSTDTSIPKAEHGAVFDIGGNRHSAGGTKFYGEDGTRFEAEKDEKLFVLNRLASKTLGPGLSRLNQAAGGRSLMSSSNFLAQGGSVARAVGGQTNVNVESGIDYDLLSTQVADKVGVRFEESIAKLPRPITDVKDIITEVDNYNEIVNGANQ